MNKIILAHTGALGNGKKHNAPPTIKPIEPKEIYAKNLFLLYWRLSASIIDPINGSLMASQTWTTIN